MAQWVKDLLHEDLRTQVSLAGNGSSKMEGRDREISRRSQSGWPVERGSETRDTDLKKVKLYKSWVWQGAPVIEAEASRIPQAC